MQIFLDLRHPPVRRALAESPIILRDGDRLAAVAWLMRGPAPLATLLREAKRFSSLSR